MTTNHLRSAALAVLALGAAFSASTAFAQTRYTTSADDEAPFAQPQEDGDGQAFLPNSMGQFTCGYNEPHTRLERKNCGGTHYAR